MDARQDLVYAYGWPSRLFQPIGRVKWAPKRAYASFRWFSWSIAHYFLGDPDSDVKNNKCYHGRPSRPLLCIRLAITDCPTHLEGQTSPEAIVPLISMIFVCYSKPFFWVIRISASKMPKKIVDVHKDLGYASGWPSRPVRPIFKDKRSLKRAYPLI